MNRGRAEREAGHMRVVVLCILGVIGLTVLMGLPRARDRIERRSDVARLAPGRILEATPRVRDGIFDEARILLVTYGPTGAVGIVLSAAHADTGPGRDGRPAALAAGVPPDRLIWGGPMGPDVVWLLSPSARDGYTEVAPGVWIQRTENAALTGRLQEEDPALRFAIGGAAWRVDQLENEVRDGVWRVRDGSADRIFGLLPSQAR